MKAFNRPASWHPNYGDGILVPVWLLEALPEIESSWLRLLLYLFFEEAQANTTGKPVDFAELSQGAGVVPEQARLALDLMRQAKFVEPIGDTSWRLKAAETTE